MNLLSVQEGARAEEKKLIEELSAEITIADPVVLSPNQNESVDGFEIKADYTGQDKRFDICYQTLHDLAHAFLYIPYMINNSIEAFSLKSSCFKDFGYMIDCSRNAVPKVETVKKLIRILSLFGYNYLGLYTEDMIEIPEEPYFGYMRGRLTQAEIKEIVKYGQFFGMEIRPFIQTLAHFDQIKRYEFYAEHMDQGNILLIDDDRTYELLDRLLSSVSESYDTKNIQLGMDEAELVGLGKYLTKHGYTDQTSLMLKHLSKVLDLCKKYDFKPAIWSDMFLKLRHGGLYYTDNSENKEYEKLDIPEGLTLSYWDYYSTEQEHYEKLLKEHFEITDNIAFAGGAWKWPGFTANNVFSIEAGRVALTACRNYGVNDVVITGWGDNGAEASQFSNLPGVFFDALMAYGQEDISDDDKDCIFEAVTGVTFADFILFDKTNPYPEEKEKHNDGSKVFLYNDPLIGTFDSAAGLNAYYEGVAKELTEALNRAGESEFSYYFRVHRNLADLLSKKCDLGLNIRKAYKSDDKATLREIAEKEIPEIIEKLEIFYDSFRNQWHIENKSFGFETQTLRLGGLKARLEETAVCLKDYLDKGERIEELEEEYLPFKYFENPDPASLEYYIWADMVSPGIV